MMKQMMNKIGRRFKSSDASKYPMGIHFHSSSVHKYLGQGFGAMMWLWIFYRAKEDGKVLLVIKIYSGKNGETNY